MKKTMLPELGFILMFTLALFPWKQARAQAPIDMALEDLMSIKVISVSKKPQNISDSAAAVSVITGRELVRSGATSIAEALRMVPGIQVGRIDSNKWAVSSRGFNNRFTKKLLVMIDGRTVYTPGFSGVYWEIQDVLLEDVERIEVIRGPGASLWGANAVNGVINIITKHASQTRGGLASAGGGTYEKAFASARYGAALGTGVDARIYAKYFNRDEFETLSGGGARDHWDSVRAGFRLDAKMPGPADLTVQGDLYTGTIHQTVQGMPVDHPPYSMDREEDAGVSGGNLLARWQQTLSATANVAVQAYYDRAERDDFYLRETRDTLDLDIQHRFSPLGAHDLVWGLGYRYTRDRLTRGEIMEFDPDSRAASLFSAFVQDEITLAPDRLWLILGTKLTHNDYTGRELQPNARLLWSPHHSHRFWAALSRAVRTPSRVDQDGHLTVAVIPSQGPLPQPITVTIDGNKAFESEELTAYEAGYRFMPDPSLSVSICTFYNDYDQLEGYLPIAPTQTGTAINQSLIRINRGKGQIRGLEISADWQPAPWMKTKISYSWLDSDIRENHAPEHQVSLGAGFALSENINVDLWMRYVDDIEGRQSVSGGFVPYRIDSYLTADLRAAWRITDRIEVILAGRNLLDSSHLEFIQDAFTAPAEVPRSVYAQVKYRF